VEFINSERQISQLFSDEPFRASTLFYSKWWKWKEKNSKEKYIRAPNGLLYLSFNKRKLDERILINRFTDSANWAVVSCVAICSQRIDWETRNLELSWNS